MLVIFEVRGDLGQLLSLLLSELHAVGLVVTWLLHLLDRFSLPANDLPLDPSCR